MSKNRSYKVVFHNQGKIYEVYARNVHQSAMFGFIEVENLVFGTRSSVVVDPSEDQLRSEFEGVARSYIPMHAVIRIDEVEKEGAPRISDGDGKVTTLPIYTQNGPKSG